MISLDPAAIQSLGIGRVIKGDHLGHVRSIDFSKDGNFLVTCDDQTLNVYDMMNGKKTKTLLNKTRKIQCVKYTHSNDAVLCATKVDFKILYWSLHDNEILKIFSGHKSTIFSLEINPINDMFISSSKDQTFKIWNLNSLTVDHEAVIDFSDKNMIAVGNFDPSGKVFALAINDKANNTASIKLYDSNNYFNGSFASYNQDESDIRVVSFSNDSKWLLYSCADNVIVLLDSFNGKSMRKFRSHINDEYQTIEAGFTPDSKFVISGSENGNIHIWDVNTGEETTVLVGHPFPSRCVKFSPKYNLLASAGVNLIFWISNSN